jgi:hypothetical protein
MTLEEQIQELITNYHAMVGGGQMDHIRNWALGLRAVQNAVENEAITAEDLYAVWHETATVETHPNILREHRNFTKSRFQSIIDNVPEDTHAELKETMQSLLDQIENQINESVQ